MFPTYFFCREAFPRASSWINMPVRPDQTCLLWYLMPSRFPEYRTIQTLRLVPSHRWTMEQVLLSCMNLSILFYLWFCPFQKSRSCIKPGLEPSAMSGNWCPSSWNGPWWSAQEPAAHGTRSCIPWVSWGGDGRPGAVIYCDYLTIANVFKFPFLSLWKWIEHDSTR